ncbi:outer membrane surface antigen [Cohaesibacter marisflavi]|uniref:Outer membrane surface antigen n=1 Tax=Cohaesibacter marisflavi TaxID=655353 RepID=A0A1I5E6C2_9HYPH|nr:RT0821/Lpp0805 family surface protein [Cohaesibacter marisflavi]SFO07002.1 outer membrane surface antigen [Cohaesibacter marisflavi]
MFGHRVSASIYSAARGAVKLCVLAACCSLGACASVSFMGSSDQVDDIKTGSIGVTDRLLAGIDPSDWQVMLNRMSSFDKVAMQAEQVNADWINPETGSKGRITQVKKLPDMMNEECRSFKSSMHRVTGVENIEGQACKVPDGSWQIVGFSTGVSV